MMAMTITLATLPRPIIPKTKTTQINVESVMTLATPHQLARKPLASRPTTLHPFNITSYTRVSYVIARATGEHNAPHRRRTPH